MGDMREVESTPRFDLDARTSAAVLPAARTQTKETKVKGQMAMSAEGFRAELEKLINRESRENGSNTPDFILADYLAGCLENFDRAVSVRETWYGRPIHGEKLNITKELT